MLIRTFPSCPIPANTPAAQKLFPGFPSRAQIACGLSSRLRYGTFATTSVPDDRPTSLFSAVTTTRTPPTHIPNPSSTTRMPAGNNIDFMRTPNHVTGNVTSETPYLRLYEDISASRQLGDLKAKLPRGSLSSDDSDERTYTTKHSAGRHTFGSESMTQTQAVTLWRGWCLS